jgi:hypothetical protein
MIPFNRVLHAMARIYFCFHEPIDFTLYDEHYVQRMCRKIKQTCTTLRWIYYDLHIA